jgi:hypothetical protein
VALDLTPTGFTEKRLAAVPGFNGALLLAGVAGAACWDYVARLINATFRKRQHVFDSQVFSAMVAPIVGVHSTKCATIIPKCKAGDNLLSSYRTQGLTS